MNDERIKRIKRSIIEISIALGVIAWGVTLYDHYFMAEFYSPLNIMTYGEIACGGPRYVYNYLSIFSIPGILTIHAFHGIITKSPEFFQLLLPTCIVLSTVGFLRRRFAQKRTAATPVAHSSFSRFRHPQ